MSTTETIKTPTHSPVRHRGGTGAGNGNANGKGVAQAARASTVAAAAKNLTDLTGRVAVVIGGTSGLGRAIKNFKAGIKDETAEKKS